MKPFERLYLSKERDQDIFVDNNNIYDHQIDGLRFLYKQFRKRKPGAILNFPSQSGKSVTIVLFLYAIRKLLHQPVLILCKDSKEAAGWQQCFQQWSDFSADDIVVEPTKALLKKQIFIKSMSDLVSFTRRSWSILVYKDDGYNGMPQFTNVGFYIWATFTDVLNDLNFLSSIYNWMSPKETISFDDGRGDLKKCILLDAKLEDIVLRKTRITTPKRQITAKVSCTAKKPKKNKDSTGSKIKRSKVIPKDLDCNQSKEENVNGNNNVNNNSKMDVETHSNIKKSVMCKDQDVFDIKRSEVNDSLVGVVIQTKISHNDNSQNVHSANTTEPVTMTNDYILRYDDTDINTNMETQTKTTDITENPNGLNNILKSNCTENEDTPDLNLNEIASGNNILCVQNMDNLKTDIKEIDKDMKSNDKIAQRIKDTENTESDIANTKQESQHVTTIISHNSISSNPNEIMVTSDSQIDEKSKGGLKNRNVNKIEQNIEYDVRETKKESQLVKYGSDLDSKMNEMQERAMKKFKGSLLDSIF